MKHVYQLGSWLVVIIGLIIVGWRTQQVRAVILGLLLAGVFMIAWVVIIALYILALSR